MKHKLISNFKMNLDSIQSQLSIAEDVDCKAGTIGFTIILKTNELEVKLEISYRLKGDYELKYYRNQQMMKHILCGNLIVDRIPSQELVTLTKIDDNNNVSNLSIISLDFCDADKKLILSFTEDKINRLVIDKGLQTRELTPQMVDNTGLAQHEEEDEEEEEEQDQEEESKKWSRLVLREDAEIEKKPIVKEETSAMENVGQAVTGFIEKGLDLFDSKSPKADPKNFSDKKESDANKKEGSKNSPYTFNQGMG